MSVTLLTKDSHTLLLEEAETAAREWFLLQQDRELNSDERQAFERWLNADTLHRACFDDMELIWQGLGQVDREGIEPEPLSEPGGVDGRWHSLSWPAMVGMAAAMVVAVWLTLTPLLPDADAHLFYTTAIGEISELSLDDGSRVTLGADSAIEVWFEDHQRRVVLTQGQAFFDVVKDPTRPFFVAIDSTTVRVVGTRFEVHRNLNRVKVSVEEGVVEVVRRSPEPRQTGTFTSDAQTTTLTAGQQVRASRSQLDAVTSLEIEDVAIWRSGRLVYRDAPLSEVIADVNRYRTGGISLGTQSLKNLKVTTSFSIEQTQSVVSMLEESLPVVVHYEAGDRILILPKSSAR